MRALCELPYLQSKGAGVVIHEFLLVMNRGLLQVTLIPKISGLLTDGRVAPVGRKSLQAKDTLIG